HGGKGNQLVDFGPITYSSVRSNSWHCCVGCELRCDAITKTGVGWLAKKRRYWKSEGEEGGKL
ncbi:MAG: hypothetical protein ACK56F_14530, partial [bacterium]